MSRSKPLMIEVQTIGEALVVSPAGLLEVATAPQLRDQLLKCMADQPGAVIVKLQNLVLAKAYTLSVFTSVAG
jgi:anti-anti-sigma regulatory factor